MGVSGQSEEGRGRLTVDKSRLSRVFWKVDIDECMEC
jgi:hypothetical protein